jgi:hypothetical protein
MLTVNAYGDLRGRAYGGVVVTGIGPGAQHSASSGR